MKHLTLKQPITLVFDTNIQKTTHHALGVSLAAVSKTYVAYVNNTPGRSKFPCKPTTPFSTKNV